MTTFRANFPDLMEVKEAYDAVLFEEYDRYPDMYSKVFTVKGTNKKQEKATQVTGLGIMPLNTEGNDITLDDPLQGYDKTCTMYDYALGFKVHDNLMDDDQQDVIGRMTRALARSAKETRDQIAFNMFNNGFTVVTGGDGKYLFATDHPLVGGGTQANRPTVAADLSITSLQAAINVFERTVDDRGLLLNIKPKILLIPPELKWTAREILDSADKPYTANNEINALQDEGLRYMVCPYLTDTNAWFLLSEKDIHWLLFYERQALKTSIERYEAKRTTGYFGVQRFGTMHADFRGTYGSPGST